LRLLAGVACAALAAPASASATASSAISAGEHHTCALTRAGAAECWGDNLSGELGDGTTMNRTTPVAVTGLGSGVAAISAGEGHTCALTSVGGVECWGTNFWGQVGDGTSMGKTTPVAVTGLSSGVTAISATGGHTCAVTSAGAVECWGSNEYGQVGDGTTKEKLSPVPVTGLGSGVTAVSVGRNYTCALTSAGAVECWGENTHGQIGDGTTTKKTAPVPVSGLGSGISAITADGFHTCALTSAGAAECWGQNEVGQLGDGTTMEKTTPVPVNGLSSGVTAISAGLDHTCALTSSGAMKCWGANGRGELGDGTVSTKTSPAPVFGLSSGVLAISAGGDHTCALTVGSVKCWGYNSNGQLGNGTTLERTTRVNVVGLYSSTCTTSTGTIKLSPGLTDTPAVQNVRIKGTLAGCTGEFTEIHYTATLTTAAPVSCTALEEAGETATGPAKYKWTPKAKSSTGTLSMLLSETPGAAFSGEVASGEYAPLALSGTTTESFKGGPMCGLGAARAVTRGTFSGSSVSAE
jgi:alpha-tubulin suppressor-like RCC1 family protein